MAEYRVEAKMTTYASILIEAQTAEAALEIAEDADGGDFDTDNEIGDWAIVSVTDGDTNELLIDCESPAAPKTVYVYKEYNEDYAYGEEYIKVFSKKESAVRFLKARVEKTHLDNEITFDEFKSNVNSEYAWDESTETVKDDYVSLDGGDGNGIFYIIEPQEVCA